MKKIYALAVTSALVLSAGVAFSAMNPTNPGLPQAWAMTTSQGYGAQTGVTGNEGSAMCVECHSVNPSGMMAEVSKSATFTPVRTNAAHRGSHIVMNDMSSGVADAPWGTTPVGNDKYEELGTWTGTTTSKYGDRTQLGTLAAGTAGEMICESCHNIVSNNLNAAADNDLLLGEYVDNVDDTLCVTCHMGSYAAFHAGGNLIAFDGAATKRHHVLTGDFLAVANYGSGTDSTMWAPKASSRLANAWCVTAYQNLLPAALDWDFNVEAAPVAILFRDACNVAGNGTRAELDVGVAPVPGDINTVVGGATINCSNCHRPHNAMSTAGGYIFRTGTGADFNGQVGGNSALLTNADPEYGLRRQADVDAGRVTKAYGEYVPLCAGCHYGYE